MRDIKFRALMYSKSLNKHFVSDGLSIDNGLSCLFGFENEMLGKLNDVVLCSKKFLDEVQEVFWERDWVHIGNLQYTGLKDKNGKEIYEGDICRTERSAFKGDDYSIGIVEYKTDGFKRKILKHNGYHDLFALHCEVIGNIYENHDLLEV